MHAQVTKTKRTIVRGWWLESLMARSGPTRKTREWSSHDGCQRQENGKTDLNHSVPESLSTPLANRITSRTPIFNSSLATRIEQGSNEKPRINSSIVNKRRKWNVARNSLETDIVQLRPKQISLLSFHLLSTSNHYFRLVSKGVPCL